MGVSYFWQRAAVAISLFLFIFVIHFLASPYSQEYLNFLNEFQISSAAVHDKPSQWSMYSEIERSAVEKASTPPNLVLITSMLQGAKVELLSKKDRYDQLLESIASVKEKVPNNFIVVLEGGSKLDEDVQGNLTARGVAVWHYPVHEYHRRVGEAQLLYSFLRMPHAFEKFASISKLTGRYSLTSEFQFMATETTNAIAKVDHSKGSVETRFFRIPVSAVADLKRNLLMLLLPRDGGRAAVKIEVDDTLGQVLFKTKLFEGLNVHMPQRLGVSGINAADGKRHEY